MARSGVRSVAAATATVAAVGLAICATVSATPPTLHLNAVVYDVHQSKGVFSSRERLAQGSTSVGEDFSSCTTASKTTARCVGEYKLKHGTLKISGTITAPSNTNRLSIVGGTGTYKGVRGTVLTEYNKAGTRAKETLTFG